IFDPAVFLLPVFGEDITVHAQTLSLIDPGRETLANGGFVRTQFRLIEKAARGGRIDGEPIDQPRRRRRQEQAAGEQPTTSLSHGASPGQVGDGSHSTNRTISRYM